MYLLRWPLGAFNELIFTCSRNRVFTFSDYERQSKARYHRHELINRTPAAEFLGPDTSSISFKMIFDISLGVKPAYQAERLRYLCEQGVADWLIIANSVIGKHLWTIESLGEKALAADASGNILVSSVDVTLKEYVRYL